MSHVESGGISNNLHPTGTILHGPSEVSSAGDIGTRLLVETLIRKIDLPLNKEIHFPNLPLPGGFLSLITIRQPLYPDLPQIHLMLYNDFFKRV
jgi:hypothetical protein